MLNHTRLGEHFDQVTQNATQEVAAVDGTERRSGQKNNGNTEVFPFHVAVCWSVPGLQAPPVRLEPTTILRGKTPHQVHPVH